MRPSRIQRVWGLEFKKRQRQRASGDCGRPEGIPGVYIGWGGAPGVYIGGQPPPSPQRKRDLGGREWGFVRLPWGR